MTTESRIHLMRMGVCDGLCAHNCQEYIQWGDVGMEELFRYHLLC